MTSLAVTRTGSGPPVGLVHGFTQTGASWKTVAADLATDHEVLCADLPGHGGSSAITANLAGAAKLLGDAIGPATYIGYSMGGRICLHLALARPELVQRLVLLGATAGIVDATERQARLDADEQTAARITTIGLSRFLQEWLSQPLFAGLPDDPAERAARQGNDPKALAGALASMSTGTQAPLWDELATLSMPVLVLAGERDQKFAAIGRQMTERIGPNATFMTVPGAGHAAHLEAPGRFLAIVRQWLTVA